MDSLVVEEIEDFATLLDGQQQQQDGRMMDESVEDDGDHAIIRQYVSACDGRLKYLQQTMEEENEEVASVEQERNTWILLGDLLSARKQVQSASNEMDFMNQIEATDRELASRFQSTDKVVAEAVVVKEWLEKIAPPVEPLEVKTTDHACVLYDLDPTMSSSQQSQLSPKEAEFKSKLLKTIFEFIRRGELGKATELCRECNEFWRAVSLMGGVYYGGISSSYEDGQPQGNRNRGLWMFACFQIANNPEFDAYERAIYASLCGNTVNVLSVCRDWEETLWAFFNSLVINATERYLFKFPRQNTVNEDGVEFAVPEVEDLSIQQIFERIEQSQSRQVADERHLLFRRIQKALILNKFDQLLEEFWQLVASEAEISPRYLRFFAHCILILTSVEGSIRNQETAANLLGAYVDLLILLGKSELALLYASKLPYEMQLNKCAGLFQKIRIPLRKRDILLRLAYAYGLNVGEIVKLAVSNALNLEKTPSSPVATLFEDLNSLNYADAVDDVDQYQIDMVLWLLAEQDLALDAILQCNRLFRRFLICGRMSAALKLRKTLLSESEHFGSAEFVQSFRKSFGDRRYENHLREFTSYGLLLDALVKYWEWQTIWQRHVEMGAEHRLSASADVRGLIETVESSLQTVLEPSKFTSWLLDEDEAETDGMAIDQQHLDSDLLERRQQEMAAIRQIFIPHVVFALHQLLFDTRIIVPKNLWKSLDIAILVASEEQRLYKEFLPLNDGSSYSAQNNRLPQLLERMRASQIELLEAQTEA